MSLPLMLLTAFCLGLAAVGIADPKRVLYYPVAASLLMVAFILPQAFAVERLKLADLLDPAYVWLYMLVCFAMILGGWVWGRATGAHAPVNEKKAAFSEQYNVDRLAVACCAMFLVGVYSFYQMSQLTAQGEYGSQWTGVITLYYLLSSLLVMSLSLSWLAYLNTKRNIFLVVALLSLIVFLPTLTVAVKRSWIFEVAIILLGGLVFVRNYVPNRAAVLAAVLAGTVLLHQVGELRSYIRDNEATVVAAISDGALTENLAIVEMTKAPEVQGAVTQVAVSRMTGEHEPGVAIWNRLVHQYVPAFIFGQNIKDGLKFESSLVEEAQNEFFWSGATTTGFADSYSGFWWFGSLCFFLVALFYGRYWALAKNGDLRAQFLYLALLNDGLIAITESISRFVSSLPFIFGVTLAVFWFIRIPADTGARARERALGTPQMSGGGAARIRE